MRAMMFSFHKILLLICLLLVAVLSVAGAAEQGPTAKETEAVAAAKVFLSMVDRGEYVQSWEQASSLFAERIPKEDWVEGISRFRPTFGAVQERTLKGSHFARSLPGAPDGEYVLILFTSTFEQKVSAVETITMMLDVDKQWRAAGYYIE